MSQTDSLRKEDATRTMTQGEAAPSSEAVSIYDRFTSLYDMMFRINGYGRSLRRYFNENPLPIQDDARILDAGCGTGLLTLALLQTLKRPARIVAVDLSHSSLQTARSAALKAETEALTSARFARTNALALPFRDESFDLVATSGVLEYLPLADGLSEMARVLRPRGHFFHLPVNPSFMTGVLELMFRFHAHPQRETHEEIERHFRILSVHRFPRHEPISWTKTAILAQKP